MLARGDDLLGLTLVVLAFGLFTLFWITMLVDCVRRIQRGEQRQIAWLVIILVTHGLGAIAYYLFARQTSPR